MSNPSGSPYKKFKSQNRDWIGYINISKLIPNHAYKIVYITSTDHPQYGKGQQATIQVRDGKKWRCQLPNKYLAGLDEKDIDVFKKDIVDKKNPYLVFREIMMDNSYRIDIIERSADMDDKFNSGAEIPELEDSLTEENDNQENGNQENGNQENDNQENDNQENENQ